MREDGNLNEVGDDLQKRETGRKPVAVACAAAAIFTGVNNLKTAKL